MLGHTARQTPPAQAKRAQKGFGKTVAGGGKAKAAAPAAATGVQAYITPAAQTSPALTLLGKNYGSSDDDDAASDGGEEDGAPAAAAKRQKISLRKMSSEALAVYKSDRYVAL